MIVLKIIKANERPFEISTEKEVFTIGRLTSSDLVISGPRTARRHLELRREASGWRLRVVAGSREAALNGAQVEGSPRLRVGDEVVLPELTFVVEAISGPQGNS